jgi:hypothetical protein
LWKNPRLTTAIKWHCRMPALSWPWTTYWKDSTTSIYDVHMAYRAFPDWTK